MCKDVDFKHILDYMLYGCSLVTSCLPSVRECRSDYQEIESEHESDADAKLEDVMVAVGE